MEALAHLVTPGSRLCDVGCDHGYLPIYLVQEQIIPSAIAMDIGEGPLLAAKTHIAEVGLEDKIQTRRSDGLAAASAEEIDTVLIAGMGGGIVIHILTEGRKVAQSVKDLILQPQSELKEVRRFLCNEGYEIVDEDMVLEDGKYYPMMKVRYVPETKARRQSVAEHDFLFGPMLLQKSTRSYMLICSGRSGSKKRSWSVWQDKSRHRRSKRGRRKCRHICRRYKSVCGKQKK